MENMMTTRLERDLFAEKKHLMEINAQLLAACNAAYEETYKPSTTEADRDAYVSLLDAALRAAENKP